MEKKKFTVIKLTVIILIFGILSILIMPSAIRYIEEARKKNFLRDVNDALETVSVDMANTKYESLVYQISGNKITDSSGRILEDVIANKLYGTIEFNDTNGSMLAIHNDKWCALKSLGEENITISKYEKGNCKIEV